MKTNSNTIQQSLKLAALISVIAGLTACLPLICAFGSVILSFIYFVVRGQLWWNDWADWSLANAWWLWKVAALSLLLALRPVRDITPIRRFLAR